MNNQEKLQILIPILCGSLDQEDFNAIASHIKLKNWNPHAKSGKTKSCLSSASSLINTIISSWNQNFVRQFPKALEQLDRPLLSEIVEKVFQSSEGSSLIRMLKHWNELLSCQTALNGLDPFISGLANVESVTVDQWYMILHKVAIEESNASHFFVAQLQRNLAFSCSQKKENIHEEVVWTKSARFLAPVIQSALKEDFNKIAAYLVKHDVTKMAEIQKFRKRKSKWVKLFDIIAKSTTPNRVNIFLRAVEEQGYPLLADTIKLYIEKNVPNLTWFVVNWEQLTDMKCVMLLWKHACQHITNQELLSEYGSMAMLHILNRVARGESPQMDQFMKAMYELIPPLRIQIRSHVETSCHSLIEAPCSTYQQQDAQTTLQNRQPASGKLVKESQSGNDASYCYIHDEIGDKTAERGEIQAHQISMTQPGSQLSSATTSNENSTPQQEKDRDAQTTKKYKSGETQESSTSNYFLRSLTKKSWNNSQKGGVADKFDEASTDVMPDQLPELKKDPESSSNADATKPSVSIEFRMFVDKNWKIPGNARFHVFIDDRMEKVTLHLIRPSDRLFAATITFIQHEIPVIYKYLFYDGNGEAHWEQLPCDKHIVNRKTNLTDDRLSTSHVMMFDVATFCDKAMSNGQFTSMYARNIKNHFPYPYVMKFGAMQADCLAFATSLKLVKEWWQCALVPVSFDLNHLSSKIGPSCRSELENYIASQSTFGNQNGSSEICQRVLVYLSILVLVMENDIAFTTPTAAYSNICAGLSLSKVDQQDLKLLYDEINQEPGLLHTVLQALETFLPLVAKSLRSLWLMPLYYVLINEGMVTYVEETWEKVKTKCNFAEIRKVDSKDIEVNSDVILAMSNLFPQLMRLYQSVVPCLTILHLINTKHAAVQNLESPMYIVRVFREMAEENIRQYTGSEKMMNWIHIYLDKLTLQSPQSQEEQNRLLSLHAKISKALLNPLEWLRFCDRNHEQMEKVLHIAIKVCASWNTLTQNSTTRMELQTAFTKLLETVANWIAKDNDNHISRNRVQFWNYLLDVDVGDENLTKGWKGGIRSTLQKILLKKLVSDKVDSVLETFTERLDTMKPSEDVQSCFSDAMYQFVDQAKKEKIGIVKKWVFWEKNNFQKLAPTFERMFKDRWKTLPTQSQTDVLQFAIRWPFTATFFKLYDERQNKKLLKQDTYTTMQYIKETLQNIVRDLESGNISFKALSLIWEAKKTFLDVLTLVEDSAGTPVDGWEALLDTRAEEMEAFLEMEEACNYLIDLNHSAGLNAINLLELENATKRCKGDVRWRDMVDCQRDVTLGGVNVKFFCLPHDVKSALKEMFYYKINDNELTRKMWLSELDNHISLETDADDSDGGSDEYDDEEKRSNLLQVNDLSSIWTSLKQRVSILKKQIDSGCLTLLQADEMFQRYDGDDLKRNVSSIVGVIYGYPASENSAEVKSLGNVSDVNSENYATADEEGTSDFGDEGDDCAARHN